MNEKTWHLCWYMLFLDHYDFHHFALSQKHTDTSKQRRVWIQSINQRINLYIYIYISIAPNPRKCYLKMLSKNNQLTASLLGHSHTHSFGVRPPSKHPKVTRVLCDDVISFPESMTSSSSSLPCLTVLVCSDLVLLLHSWGKTIFNILAIFVLVWLKWNILHGHIFWCCTTCGLVLQ